MNNGFFSFIKDNKRIFKIGVFILIGLVLIFSAQHTSAKKTESGEMTLDEYRASLEEQLCELCRSVEGVGKCRVFITLERGEQNSYKGSQLMETKPPRVLGVTVVCRGADSDYVRSELTEMLCALFDIGANRVAVLKLNS